MSRLEDDEDLEITVLIGETLDDLVFTDNNDESLNKEQSRIVTIIQVPTLVGISYSFLKGISSSESV